MQETGFNIHWLVYICADQNSGFYMETCCFGIFHQNLTIWNRAAIRRSAISQGSENCQDDMALGL